MTIDRATKEIPFVYVKVNEQHLELEDLLKHGVTFQSGNPKLNDLQAVYWFKLDFSNELDTLTSQKEWILHPTYFSKAFLYLNENGSVTKRPIGKFNKLDAKTSMIYTPGVKFTKQNLIDQRYLYLEAHLTFPIPNEPRFEYISNSNNRFFTHYYTKEDLNLILPDQIYLGACGIIFLTFLIIYFNILKPEFLFYAFYVVFSAFYLVQDNITLPGYNHFYDHPLGYWSIVISQVLINLFYVLFAIFYLDTKKNYPLLHRAMQGIVVFLILLIATDFWAYISENYVTHYTILNLQRIVMTLFGFFSMVYLLIKFKDRLALFVVTGSFFYMAGALAYLFTINKYHMIIGSMIEIIIFSLGLAYKIKQEHEGSLVLQQEVMSKEICALRAQMNPHFIFNALSSIQHLILNNDKKSALTYLSKFGKLARNVLESSREATVSLTEEIDLLRSYLELESLRFDKAFQYSIEIDGTLDTDSVEIPLMLLQPFAENAIIHGLVGKKKGDKSLFIRILTQGEYHVFEIEDNGVGRFPAKSKKKDTRRKSRGMEITQKRLKMLDKTEENKNTVEIVDKYDTTGNPSGTKVIIRIHNP
ncbi:MAG: histidine kinase [Muricauda sp.]|nr:histidine kinase [Allomuricauda sp.]